MDKSFLNRLNSFIVETKRDLLLDEEIRKLLYYSSEEYGEDVPTPAIGVVQENIFLQPIIDTDVVEPYNKKNYITITMPEATKKSNKIIYTFRVMVMCDRNDWSLGNNVVRPLVLSQHIINILEGKKTFLAGPLEFDAIYETVTNKNVCGYSIVFEISDGIADEQL